ncbi:NepR family anti-sigma factor [Sphingobium sp. WCS2017Hpa-17]|uniref:NepR family anti-sigma factor n=1 Tax=Sphingobium sp. WCS2017Hpa-17 TaxID=3073638 RepID=UPI00288AB3B0|nr:NepR family anti-sigma factor [Sphingobium sp. WCS2017Hpa-17]
MAEIAAEGLILVSSTTERGVADDDKSADAATGKDKVKGSAAQRKRQPADSKEDGNVSHALRTVYQRAVEEDIPSEMLDLLSKLD